MLRRLRFDQKRAAVFVDLDSLRYSLSGHQRHYGSEPIGDILAWATEPHNLMAFGVDVDAVSCRYIFGSYNDVQRPSLPDHLTRSDAPRDLRLRSYARHKPYSWRRDITQSIRRSSGEWEVAIFVSSSPDALDMAARLQDGFISGVRDKQAVVVHGHMHTPARLSHRLPPCPLIPLEAVFATQGHILTA